MNKRILKYTASAGIAVMFFGMVFASPLPAGRQYSDSSYLFPASRGYQQPPAGSDPAPAEPFLDEQAAGMPVTGNPPEESARDAHLPSTTPAEVEASDGPANIPEIIPGVMPGRENPYRYVVPSNEQTNTTVTDEAFVPEPIFPDGVTAADTVYQDTLPASDSVRYKNFLDDVISGTSKDSLVYDVKAKKVYIYRQGDVTYQATNLVADYMEVTMNTKELLAYGVADSLGKPTRPEFKDGGANYTMDTINYNISTGKAKIKGVATQEGEGFLLGDVVKKHADGTIHMHGGKYTTCDDPDCPHFYLRMTKAKVIPGKKVVTGPAYLVMEDVPLYILMIPEAFFPMSSGRKSGLIIPSYGEEQRKGFFLRDGGYYMALSDHADLTLLGGIYTQGSWELSAASRYTKRYKYNGNFSLRFSNDKIGEKDDADYTNQRNFRVAWTHTQDAKFRPSSSFNASVNLSTSGYVKNSSVPTLSDALNTQTNSSISYQKSWPGTPFSFSTNLQHSQNSSSGAHQVSFPNAVISMSRINPLKRKNPVGKQRWYEKISMSYTGTLSNSVSLTEEDIKEHGLFSPETFKNMNGNMQHRIPVQTSFNLFNYINISPSVNYNERWNYRKIEQRWNDQENKREPADTTYGFYRLYNYNASISASTKIYGTYLMKSKTFFLQAVRHTITPSVSMTLTPNFGNPNYGFYEPIQTDVSGTIDYYSPHEGAPGRNASASIGFSVAQTLEAKVLSKTDTSGLKKIKIIDNFSFSGSYNLLADSMKLSTIALNLRATLPFLKNFGLNLSAVLDPYVVINNNGRAQKINKFMLLEQGKLGRIASTGWSFGYTFNGGKSGSGQGQQQGQALNNINTHVPGMAINDMEMLNPWYYNPDNPIDPSLRRQMMVQTYYDFSIPWNFGFNYSVNYRNDGVQKNITQTINFNGSVTLTPKWGLTFNGGFDFVKKELTPGTFTLTRDLHCWQFNFNWVPVGRYKSWSFNISVKSSMLKDLKYDKRHSHYDNIYEQ